MAHALKHHCRIHPHRAAAARCPACGRDYCRECVSEHDGKLLCAACIQARLPRQDGARRPRARMKRTAEAALGFMLIWAALYLTGMILTATPTQTHEYLFRGLRGEMGDTLPEED